MERVTCRYCGLPFKVRRVELGRDYFCCTGCAMLARIPVDAKGEFPVNAQLVSALAVGFIYFNQLLCWLLGALLMRQDKVVTAERFLWIGACVALVVWAAVLVVQLRERTLRTADSVVLALAFAAHSWAFVGNLPPAAWTMAATNAVLIAWSLRGVVLRRQKK